MRAYNHDRQTHPRRELSVHSDCVVVACSVDYLPIRRRACSILPARRQQRRDSELLTLFALILLFIRKRLGNRLIVGFAVAALAIFGISSYQMSFVGNDAEDATLQEAIFDEFQTIRDKIPPDKIVHIFIPSNYEADTVFAGSTRASIFYLSGRIIVHGERPRLCRLADFAITTERDEGAALLTPHNRLRFLYRRSPYPA